MKSPQVTLAIDRDKAASLSVDAGQIEGALYSSYGPRWSSTVFGDATQYRVLMEIDPKYQENVDALSRVSSKHPPACSCRSTPSFSARQGVAPQTVNHSGGMPAVAVSFNLKPGVSLGEAVARIRALASAMLPPSMTIGFEGSAKVFEDSTKNLGLLLLISIAVVYIVLGMLYESYIHPLTILSGLPSAGLGALVTLWLFGNELNVYSFVGLIMLDRHREEERHHADRLRARRRAACTASRRHDAIIEGCVVRFRPDHDDDDGGAARGAADRAGPGRRRRSAASAGPCRRRRPARLAAHYAVSHAGRLHVHGGVCPRQAFTGSAAGPRNLESRYGWDPSTSSDGWPSVKLKVAPRSTAASALIVPPWR